MHKLYVGKNKHETITFNEAASRLKKRMLNLDNQTLKRELTGLVPESYLQHTPDIIKNSMARLCQKLDVMD